MPLKNYKTLCTKSKLTRLLCLAASGGVLAFYSLPSYAYFCSGNGFNGYINVGDSPAKVMQACGQPTTQTSEQPKKPDVIQYWTYTNQALITTKNMSAGQVTSQVKSTGPMIVVKVAANKVTSISVNGQSATTASCNARQTIQINSTSSDVLLGCGNPNSITSESTDNASPPPAIPVWTYNYGSYRNPLVLKFSPDGSKLQSIAP